VTISCAKYAGLRETIPAHPAEFRGKQFRAKLDIGLAAKENFPAPQVAALYINRDARCRRYSGVVASASPPNLRKVMEFATKDAAQWMFVPPCLCRFCLSRPCKVRHFSVWFDVIK
jgi:hypothetical protein